MLSNNGLQAKSFYSTRSDAVFHEIKRRSEARFLGLLQDKHSFDNAELLDIVAKTPMLCTIRYSRHMHPLWKICKFQPSLELVEMVYAAHPPAIQESDSHGRRCVLHVACEYKASPDVIRFLVSKWPKGLRLKNQFGRLPLHLACNKGVPLESISLLVLMYPESLQEKDDSGYLPLHTACTKGASLKIISFLALAYPNGAMEKDAYGYLPLHRACGNEPSNDVIYFLSSMFPKALNEKTQVGWIPLHTACQNRRASIKELWSLVSCFPDIVDPLVPIRAWGKWQLRQGNAGAFALSSYLNRECTLLSGRCDDDEAVERITIMLQADTGVKCIILMGGGMQHHMVQPVARALQANQTLLCLGLGNNPIGDAGADWLAKALNVNMTLEKLDVHGCNIGVTGLSSLLKALHKNTALAELNLSYNSGIFNRNGGQLIMLYLPFVMCLKRLYLFQDEQAETALFFEELMHLLQWNPSKFAPVLLNCLTSQMIGAIFFYQKHLHGNIVKADPSVRLSLWHFILEQVNIENQSNAELIFFYVRELLHL